MKICSICGMYNNDTDEKCNYCDSNNLFHYYYKNDFNEIITHNGKMHTDEVCAIALLLILFPTAKIIRTRDTNYFNKKEGRLVIDVGNKLNKDDGLFDHHHLKIKRRINGREVYYSSFGIIWEHFGNQIIFNIAKENNIRILKKMIPKLFNVVLRKIAVPIDISDTTGNGNNNIDNTNLISIQSIINDFNGIQNTDEKFMIVVKFFQQWFIEYIKSNLYSKVMENKFKIDFDKAIKENTKYCILSEVGNWIRFVSGKKNKEKYKSILFTIYQDVTTNNWKIQGIPIECSNRAVRMKIPHEALLCDGILFVHENQFIAEAIDLNSAINMVNQITKN